ncbi:hypothetical protein [Kaistia soli]|nr:hypothetical protein [Kaistia soli]
MRAETPVAALPNFAEPSPAAVVALRAHPAFDLAMAIAADGIIRHFDGKPLLNRLMNDRGRILFAVGALYLDAEPDTSGLRLTAARLIEFAGIGGYASAGRAKAMIALLRWQGYLEDGPISDDRRQRPLVPTEKLWATVLDRWQSVLQALSVLRPVGGEALASLDDHAFRASIAVTMGRAFRAGFRPLQSSPRLAALAERDAGLVMLLVVVGTTRQGGEAPPIASLARRFGVSRAHARAVLREAEDAGLLLNENGSAGGVPTEVLRTEMSLFFGSLLALFEQAATIAVVARTRRSSVVGVALPGDALHP